MAEYFKLKFFDQIEEEINFDSFMKFPMLCFKLVFFNFKPLTANPNFREKLQNFLRSNLCRLCLLTIFLTFISLCNYVIFNAENFLSTSGSVLNIVSALQLNLTTFILYAHRKNIWNIFEDLRDIFANHIENNSKYNLKQYLDDYHFFVKIYATTFIAILLSLVIPTFNYLFFGTRDLTTAHYWFPFDPLLPRNFPIALFWIDFVDWCSLVFKLSADSLIYALITVVAMEFDILKINFMNIKLTSKQQRMDKLKILIRRHNKLLDIGEKLQNIYGTTLFVSFMLSSFLICFIVFMISTANDFASFSFYVPYLFIIVLQILLMCFYGQKILDSSTAVTNEIFHCGWEEFNDNKFTKYLMLIMVRTQRPKRLTGMKFFDVTLASFTSVSYRKEREKFEFF